MLEQRNKLLKQLSTRGTSLGGSLPVWNQQLVAYGAPIIERRREFLERLQIPAAEAQRHITEGAESLELVYEPSFPLDGDVAGRYEEQLTENREEEIRRGVTLFGPHRDDVTFLLNGRDVRAFGSLGQQRSVTLSLKIAELKLVREAIGEEPIVVMDDIFAELDRHRVARLLEQVLPGRQSIIATTEVERLSAEAVRGARCFSVRAGNVIGSGDCGETDQIVDNGFERI